MPQDTINEHFWARKATELIMKKQKQMRKKWREKCPENCSLTMHRWQ